MKRLSIDEYLGDNRRECDLYAWRTYRSAPDEALEFIESMKWFEGCEILFDGKPMLLAAVILNRGESVGPYSSYPYDFRLEYLDENRLGFWSNRYTKVELPRRKESHET